VKFSTGLPGLTRYPPITKPWETTLGPADFQLVARTADELGFHSLAIPEHIVMPSEMVELMGPFWTHALTAMAFVAGATTRLVVDSSVVVLPYHDPIVFAKAISTLDFLSGGRVRLSVGVGHAEREFEVLGVPFHERGRITDEYLAAMIELWTSDEPVFHGEYVNFGSVAFEPKPTQQPHPPIWIGGNSRAAMRRAARHDGWFPWLITADELPACLDYIRALPEFAARTRPLDVALPVSTLRVSEDHRPLDADSAGEAVLPKGKQATIDAVGHLEEIGVTWTSIPTPLASSLSEYLDSLHWVAEEVMPVFRGAGVDDWV
jgi:probable F420-dependent oxidoreductase